MSSLDPPPPLCGAIVTEVTLVDRLERQERGAFQSDSLPGHLIHVCVSGEVEQRSGGVTQRFEAGDAVWYYENEPVQGSVLTPPWIFYTVNFRAPSLLPPPLPQRVCSAGPNAADRMADLLDVWRSTEFSPYKTNPERVPGFCRRFFAWNGCCNAIRVSFEWPRDASNQKLG